MALHIPNAADATHSDQAAPDSTDVDALVLGQQRTGVITGCAVSQRAAGANMSVDVAVGTAVVGGAKVAVTAVNKVIGAADATHPRWDLVSVSNAGTVTVTTGTAATIPAKPAIPATSAPLAAVYVPAAATSITTGEISDRRVVLADLLPDVFNIVNYGATTGSSDNTAAIQAAINAANSNGGGIVYVPAGAFVCTGQLSIPGGVSAGQVPITIQGCSPQGIGMANIEASEPTAASVLDLRYSDVGVSGKIVALYEGIFGLRNIRIGCTDATKDDTALVFLTMPQPRIDSVTFFGNTTHRLTACLQDAIVFGGTGATHAENSTASAFSGYGGFVRGCSFWAIRKHVLMQNWCNGILVEGNITDRSSCGSAETNSAPYVIDPSANDVNHYADGNVFQNNTIEVEQYNYAFRFKNGAKYNVVRGNGIWDPQAGTTLGLAYVEESTGCTNNWLIFDSFTHSSFQNLGGVTVGAGLNIVDKVGTISRPTTSEFKPASWIMYLNGTTTGTQSITYDSGIDGPLLTGFSGVGIKSAGRNQKTGLYVGSGSPETVVTAGPGSAYFNVAGGASTSFYVKESGTGNTGWVAYGAPGGGGGSLSSSSNYLTADVTMSSTGTFFDGPSLTLAAGTYLLSGSLTFLAATSAVRTFNGKLWDGTNVVSNAVFQVVGTAAAAHNSAAFSGLVSPASSTTYKISASTTVANDKIAHNSQKGSYLLAVKIA